MPWIFFDAVGTLIEPDPPVAVAYWQVGRKYGSRLTLAEVDRRFHDAFAELERQDSAGDLRTSEARERQRWREIVRRVFADVRNPAACFQELFDHFAVATSWRCFPDAEPVLRSLRERGYRLGIASNFDERLRTVLTGLPIGPLVELHVVSSAVGFRKPSPAFFAAVAHAAQSPAQQVLYVGDDPLHDLRGAREAGMSALQINRDASESGPAATRTLRESGSLRPVPEVGGRKSEVGISINHEPSTINPSTTHHSPLTTHQYPSSLSVITNLHELLHRLPTCPNGSPFNAIRPPAPGLGRSF